MTAQRLLNLRAMETPAPLSILHDLNFASLAAAGALLDGRLPHRWLA